MQTKLLITILTFSSLIYSKVMTYSLEEVISRGDYFIHFKVLKVDTLRVITTEKGELISKCVILDRYKGSDIQDTINITFISFNGKPQPKMLAVDNEYLASLNKNGINFKLSSPY